MISKPVTFTDAVLTVLTFFAGSNNSKQILLSQLVPFYMYCSGQLIHCLKISGNKNNLRTIWGWNRQTSGVILWLLGNLDRIFKRQKKLIERNKHFPYSYDLNLYYSQFVRRYEALWRNWAWKFNFTQSSPLEQPSLAQPHAQPKADSLDPRAFKKKVLEGSSGTQARAVCSTGQNSALRAVMSACSVWNGRMWKQCNRR